MSSCIAFFGLSCYNLLWLSRGGGGRLWIGAEEDDGV